MRTITPPLFVSIACVSTWMCVRMMFVRVQSARVRHQLRLALPPCLFVAACAQFFRVSVITEANDGSGLSTHPMFNAISEDTCYMLNRTHLGMVYLVKLLCALLPSFGHSFRHVAQSGPRGCSDALEQ